MEWREEWLDEYMGDAGCLGWYFGSAWGVAGLIFGSDSRYLEDEDRVIEWLYRIRGVLGFSVIIFAGVRYHDIGGGLAQAYDSIADSFNWTALFMLAAGLPAMAAVVWFTNQGSRRKALAQLRYPALAMGGFIASFYLLVAFFHLPVLFKGAGELPLAIVVVVAAPWLLLYCLHAAYLISTGLFRLGDGHPLLAPVAGPAVTWALVIRALILGGNSGYPGSVNLILLFGGPVSVSALSVVEVLRLRQKYPADFPFRSGPQAFWLRART